MGEQLTPTGDIDANDESTTTTTKEAQTFIHSFITTVYYCENARILYSAFSSGSGDNGTCWNCGSK
jgi:hypothetical protein